MFEYCCAFHMHSIYSDGSGTIEEIVEAGKESGLDIIILTDHNTLRALKDGYEKWYGNTLFLVGCELNDKENKNHYLALGIKEAFSTRTSAKTYIKKVNDEGGFGFIAHPFEKRNHMAEHPAYPWTEWDTDEFTGIEIWNHMSEWMENLTEQNKYQAFMHPLKTITEPNKDAIKKWDELNLVRAVPGIGGVDAHAHKYNLLGFFEVEIFPYKVLFKSIRTHILVDRELKKNDNLLEESKKAVYNALRKGESFISNFYHSDAKGFRFYAVANKKQYIMGNTIKYDKGIVLHVEVPKKADIKIIMNGSIVLEEESNYLEYEATEKGSYRVEVYLNKKGWIYSNHIRIGI